MGLMESLVINLGSSIVKTAFKLWFKDNEFAQDISITLTDMIERKISDIVPQRKTQRFFERISDEIAEELIPVLDLDFDYASDQDKNEAILAVSNSLTNTKLNKKILLDQDLDPLKLEEYVRAKSPKDSEGLNENAINIYNFILRESCGYIVEITTGMPDFYLDVTGEILKRESESIELAKTIVRNMPKGRVSSSEYDSDTLFETDYLRKITTKLDRLDLLGISLFNIRPKYNLSVAYIGLSVDTNDNEYFIKRTKVEDVLRKITKLLIRGEPGSGKTTLLKWIAVSAARANFPENMSHWNEYIPFFIKLRSYATGNFPAPENFIDLIASNIKGYMPTGWVHRKLESGKALVLIDGVDEISPKLRGKAQEWIEDLTDEFPDAKYIVTSRPPAIPEYWLDDYNFESRLLQPMNMTDISLFIDHWHKAAREILIDSKELDQLHFFKQKMKAYVTDIPTVRNLSTNPLLCALLCALNLDRKSKLPQDRMELYRIAIESLIERRDLERDVPREGFPKLTRTEKELFLQDYAYWLLKNNLSSSNRKNCIKRIAYVLKSMPHIKDKPNYVFQYLLERSCLLREPELGYIDFLHRNFQEYLAAKALIEENDIGLLIKNSNEDQWREVIRMAVGHTTKEKTSKILKSLLIKAEKDQINSRKLKLIALSCQETAHQITPSTQKQLDQIKKEVFPPTNSDEAKEMSAAGESAINLLSQFAGSTLEISISCIQALTYIGTNRSIEALKGYCDDKKPIMETLIWAWDYFDQKTFAKTVFSESKYNGPIEFWDKSSIVGINYFKHLEKLSLLSCTHLTDLSPISELKNLKVLKIGNCPSLKNLEALSFLKKLNTLYLDDCSYLQNISELSNLKNLQYLSLKNSKSIYDLSALKNMKKLKYVNLEGCIEIEDIFPLKNLTSLEEINIDGCYGIRDLSILCNLNKLKKIVVPELGLADTLPSYLREQAVII